MIVTNFPSVGVLMAEIVPEDVLDPPVAVAETANVPDTFSRYSFLPT